MGHANDPTGALALHPESCSPDCPQCGREEAAEELRDEIGCDAPVWDAHRWVPCRRCARCDAEAEPMPRSADDAIALADCSPDFDAALRQRLGDAS